MRKVVNVLVSREKDFCLLFLGRRINSKTILGPKSVLDSVHRVLTSGPPPDKGDVANDLMKAE